MLLELARLPWETQMFKLRWFPLSLMMTWACSSWAERTWYLLILEWKSTACNIITCLWLRSYCLSWGLWRVWQDRAPAHSVFETIRLLEWETSTLFLSEIWLAVQFWLTEILAEVQQYVYQTEVNDVDELKQSDQCSRQLETETKRHRQLHRRVMQIRPRVFALNEDIFSISCNFKRLMLIIIAHFVYTESRHVLLC